MSRRVEREAIDKYNQVPDREFDGAWEEGESG